MIREYIYFVDDNPNGTSGMTDEEIVRCKECRWRKQDKSCDLNCRIEYLDGTETDMWFYTEDDDYCSYGERGEREGE